MSEKLRRTLVDVVLLATITAATAGAALAVIRPGGGGPTGPADELAALQADDLPGLSAQTTVVAGSAAASRRLVVVLSGPDGPAAGGYVEAIVRAPAGAATRFVMLETAPGRYEHDVAASDTAVVEVLARSGALHYTGTSTVAVR